MENQNAAKHVINRRAAALGLASAGVIAATQANALDVATATSGSDSTANIETAAVWALGIVVLIYGAKKVIGFFGR